MSAAPMLDLFILCYNRPDFAREAIRSALAQSDPRFRLIVSDNSTGDAVKNMVAADFPQVEYRFRDPHLDALTHFNRCLDESTAPLVCLFHDDDLLDSRFVGRVVETAARFPHAVAFGVNAWVAQDDKPLKRSFDTAGPFHGIDDAKDVARHYFSRYQPGIAPLPGYVYVRAVMGETRFDLSGGKYSDVSWLTRLAMRGPLVWIAEPLMTYRVHESSDGQTESVRDRLRLFGFFKRHAQMLGPGLIDDYRFFFYKKLIDMHSRQAHPLPPRRRATLAAFMTGYRRRRWGRIDHHGALLRRTWVRMAGRLASRGAAA
jgi:glycosyltransferase involved in cell wall biosynthesis